MKKIVLFLVLIFCAHVVIAQADTTEAFNKIEAKIALDKFEDALVILEKFEQGHELNKETKRHVFYKKIKLYELMRDRNATLELIYQTIAENPTDFDYLSYAGYTLTNSGEFDAARDCLSRALPLATKQEDSLSVYYSFSTFYVHQGKSDSVIIYSKKIQALDSLDTGSFANMALAYSIQGNPQKSIEVMHAFLKIDTTDSWLGYNNLALYYLEAQDFISAKKYFEIALEKKDDCAFCYSNLGFCYHSLGDYNTAIQYYNISIELDPGNSWVYKNKGLTYLRLNRQEEACKYFMLSKNLGYKTFYGAEVDELLEKHCDQKID